MTHNGAVGALRGPLERTIGATASANIFRNAQIDRPEVEDADLPRALAHRGGPETSDKSYGSRRYADALAAIQRLLAEEEAEFSQYDLNRH